MNPMVPRAVLTSLRPRALLGPVGAALLVLAAARGVAPAPDDRPGLRVTPGYVGFCRAELDTFREVLGPDASVEREEHIVQGDRRCAYRISLNCLPPEKPKRGPGRRGKPA